MSSTSFWRPLLLLFMILHLITVSGASWFKRFVPQQRDTAECPTCSLSASPIGTEMRDWNATGASSSLTSGLLFSTYFASSTSTGSVASPNVPSSSSSPSTTTNPGHLSTPLAPVSVTSSSTEDQDVSTSIQILTTVILTSDKFTFTLSRSPSSFTSASFSDSAGRSSSSSESSSPKTYTDTKASEATNTSLASDTAGSTTSSQTPMGDTSQTSIPNHESIVSMSTPGSKNSASATEGASSSSLLESSSVKTPTAMNTNSVSMPTDGTVASSAQIASTLVTGNGNSTSAQSSTTLQTQASDGSSSSPTISEASIGTETPSEPSSSTQSLTNPSASSSSQQLLPLTFTTSSTSTVLRSDSTFVTVFVKTVTTSIVQVSSQLSSSQSTATLEHSQADSGLSELAESTPSSSGSSLVPGGTTPTTLVPPVSGTVSVFPMLTGSRMSCVFDVNPWCGPMPTTLAESTLYCLCPVCYDGMQACKESKPEGTICPLGWLCSVTTPPGVSTSVAFSLPKELTYATISPSIWNSTYEMITRTDSSSKATHVTWTATLSTSTQYLQNGVRVEFPSWTWLCIGPFCKPVGLNGLTEFAVDSIKCLLSSKCHKPDNGGWEWPPVPVITPIPPSTLSWMTEPKSMTGTEMGIGTNDHSSKTTSVESSLTTNSSDSSSSSSSCSGSTYSTCYVACTHSIDTTTSRTCGTSCSVFTQCSGTDTTIITISTTAKVCSPSPWWNDAGLSPRIASWVTQFPILTIPEIVPNTTVWSSISLSSSLSASTSLSAPPSPSPFPPVSISTTNSSTPLVSQSSTSGQVSQASVPATSKSTHSRLTEDNKTPTTTVPFKTPVSATHTTQKTAAASISSFSEVRKRCATWDPVGNGVGSCGLITADLKISEQAVDVYEGFCQELVNKKLILPEEGGEHYTPGECGRIYVGKNDKDPLSLGIALDKTGCNKDDDTDWLNGVDMVKYGTDQCRNAFCHMIVNGCRKYWLNCLRFTAATLDENDSAPETLPPTTVAA
ncbi:hypothetical protein LTR84_002429 [Exophiala bonariae]|uniref:Uncharacterized protein n=1 Tax=Exophiala bonariae TaxID=1690606 RepID=A0AAV9NBS3_9EURO|nr:hypothetical protein LTR84_002429 [Exophiala bonariae]